MFKVKVKVANPRDPQRSFEEDFWVDTGALYSLIPEDRLAEIGLVPHSTRLLTLADGRPQNVPFGQADFTVEGLKETNTCQVAFAPKGSLYLLGATTLEAFGVEVDPTGKRLKPMLAIIGGFLASRDRPVGE
ncbi:MAG: aspartyl protease family protein [Phycisphaerae bacterium]